MRSKFRAFVCIMVVLVGLGACAGAVQAERLVVILGGAGAVRMQFYEEFAAAFEDRFGVEVELTPVGWGDLNDTVITRAAAGVQVDLIQGGMRSPVIFKDAGVIIPFTSQVERWGKMSDYPAPLWAPGTFDGEIYQIADHVHTEAMWWHTGLFAQAGLDPNVGPQTWDEIIEMGRKTAHRSPDGALEIVGFDFGGVQSLQNFLPQAGGRFLTETPPYRPVFHEVGGLAAFEFAHELIHEHQISPPGRRWFIGDVAMAFTHAQPMAAADNPDRPLTWDDIGQGGAISKSADIPPRTRLLINGYMMSSTVADPDLAWAFLAMLHEPEWQIRRAEVNPSDLPTRFSAIAEISAWADPIKEPFLRGMFEVLEYGHTYPETPLVAETQAWSALEEQYKRVIDGEISPYHAIVTARELVQGIMAQ